MKTKQFLNLSFELAKAEFKLQNEGSYLGILWYLLNPVLMFLILLIIFSKNLGSNIPNYSLYLLLGIIMFNLFQQIAIESTKVLRNYKSFIRSTKFSYHSLLFSVILKFLISHVLELVIFTVYALAIGNSMVNIIFYPILLMLFCLFIYGLVMILSAVSIYFVDLENIWIFVSRLLWFLTPIFYSSTSQPILEIINYLNPIYYFIAIARTVVIYQSTPDIWLIVGMFIYIFLFFTIGLFIFDKLKNRIAEVIR